MVAKTIGFVIACFALASCSSIKSIKNPDTDTEGLVYYMPQKSFSVSITVTDKVISDIALGTTVPYPDTSKRYVLQHGSNAFGKNTADFTITEQGLLSIAKSKTDSSVSDAFKSLGGLLGSKIPFESERLWPADKKTPPAATPCTQTNGIHTYIYQEAREYSKDSTGKNSFGENAAPCGLKLKITALAANGQSNSEQTSKVQSTSTNEEHSGIFYRQNIPYLMEISDAVFSKASIVFVPSKATHFLPASKTFFSNNEANFALQDGVVTGYKQTTEGEVVALLKIPADILSAYFSAIGTVFDSFKTNDSKEVLALNESVNKELAKNKVANCLAAIRAKNEAQQKALGCGQ